ncbi:MAG: RNA polymerase sigma-I factor [Gemmataceae bacterium]
MGVRFNRSTGTDSLLGKAKAGDSAAREQLIQDFTPFVLKVASQAAGRYLRPGADDEISVALLAFNQAIDDYQSGRGAFVSFAQTVIKRRLIDYWRRRPDGREMVLTDLEEADDEGHVSTPVLDRVAQATWQMQQEEEQRRHEIEEYQDVLREYGIRLEDLVKTCPKHRDARERAIAAARQLAEDNEMRQHLVTRKELPIKQLGSLAWASRKTLERHRKYIIAVAVILLHDWPHLRSFVTIGAAEGES